MTARWWCRMCRAKGHDGPTGARTHVAVAHSPANARFTSQVSFGFTGYQPMGVQNTPAVNQPWAGP